MTAVDATATSSQRFCSALAGVEGISARLASSALAHGRERFGTAVDDLLATFEQGGLAAVQLSDHVGKARALAYFLYTGLLPDVDGSEVGGDYDRPTMSEEDYFESLMWRVVQAHPRGLSGGYFGQWHYPPEDDDGSR